MWFVKGVDQLNKVLTYLVGLALLMMTISIFYQVLVRFVFTYFDMRVSAPWTEELARYLMIWSIFLGGAVAARKGKLIAVEALVHAVPALPGVLLKLTAHLISILFFIYIFLIGIDWVKFGFSETAPVMKFSMAYVYLSLPVGAALMIINSLALLIDSFLNRKDIRNMSVENELEEVFPEQQK